MEPKMILIYIACLIGILIIGKIFIVPLKLIFKLLINSIIGIVLLYLINIIGETWQFHIGINCITAAVTGILGIPGVILLTVVKIIIL